MNSPLISIIVPCYKVENYLHNCIRHIIAQTYSNWELILVDDGSPDKSGEICDYYAGLDNRIRVIHKKNGGLSSARNAGLDIMTGEYVTFCDSDDFLHEEYLSTLIELIITKHSDIAQCDFVRGSATHFPYCNIVPKVVEYTMHELFIRDKAKIIIWGKMYKSSLFDSVRMPVGFINEDDWTTWKLYHKATKIVVTNQPLYYYTHNPNSIMNAKRCVDLRFIDAYDERITYFKQNNDRILEHCSHRQLCKSLLLTYCSNNIDSNQQNYVYRKFCESWTEIKRSKIIPNGLKILFEFFYLFPSLIRTCLYACRKLFRKC